MKHIYLSPHLDDAALSCGGAIHHHATSGDRVQVITVFAGEAKMAGRQPSAFAQQQHEYWGNPPGPMALRRGEDVAAMTLLGAEYRHLGELDAVYRAAGGEWLYPDLDSIFGALHPADQTAADNARELGAQLEAHVPRHDDQVVYAPLGIGGHVDHQITHMAACRLGELGHRVAFYEDYPYAESADPAHVHDDAWRRETIALDVADLKAKIAALYYYRTQLQVLFGGHDAMPSRVWAFAATRSPQHKLAERVWWPR
jgi:LmbE family N-acetylglucosaminyl deacetylase